MSGVLDFVEDVVNDFLSVIEDVFDVIGDIIEFAWKELVMPILEEVFSWLGFEGKTIVNAFVVINPVYGRTYTSPFKFAVVNRLKYDTDIVEEIKNIYLTGEHVRLRSYLKYGIANNLSPDSHLESNFTNCPAAKTIIETELGETITVESCIIKFPTTTEYCFSYILANTLATTYVYNQSIGAFVSGGNIYVLSTTDPYQYDIATASYDVSISQLVDHGVVLKSVVNDVPVVPATYSNNTNSLEIVTIDSIGNTATTVIPTYSVASGIEHVVTLDTVSNPTASAPATTYGVIITSEHRVVLDTVSANSVSIVSAASLKTTKIDSVLQDAIPEQLATRRQYLVQYRLDSDPALIRYWFYELFTGDNTHPELYANTAGQPVGDTATVLPVAVIKANNVWLNDTPSTPTAVAHNKLLKKFGLSLDKLTEAYKKDAGGGNGQFLSDIFFTFGVPIAEDLSQPVLQYLYNFFLEYVTEYAVAQDVVDYTLYVDDVSLIGNVRKSDYTFKPFGIAILPRYDGPAFSAAQIAAVARWSPAFKKIYDNPGCIPERMLDKTFCLDNTFWAIHYLDEARSNLFGDGGSTVNYIIKSANYNMSLSHGPVTLEVISGEIIPGAQVGFIKKEVIPSGYKLILYKQINSGQYTKATIPNLVGFTMVAHSATEVKLAKYDFVGETANNQNIANNLIIPMTYSTLDSLGIIDRKRVITECAYTVIYGVQLTELEWYETPEFLDFFDLVLKVVSVVYVFFTADASGAELLWSAVKYYGTKTIVEKVIQEILLANPDSALAQVLAVGLAIVGSSVGGDFNFDFDGLMTGVHATSQATAVYVDVKQDILKQDFAELTETQEEEQDRLQEAIDNFDIENQGLIDYIKEQVTIRFENPELFMTRTLNISPTDEFLDIARALDLDFTFEKPLVSVYDRI